MNVKAQGLINAAIYIEQTYGRDTLGEILRACSPAMRETYTSSIAINWHPVEELIEFVDMAETKLQVPKLKIATQIGAAGARANMKGMLLRLAFYVGKPEYLMKRAAALWRQFNDEGSMELTAWEPRFAQVEVKGVHHPNETFCAIITGWCHEMCVALGVRHPTARHPECRARGDARCLFEVRGDFTTLQSTPPPPSDPH
jgi:hypothetical protein